MNVQAEVIDEQEQRLNAVLGAYLELADAGCAPDRNELLAHYPDLASKLRAFFTAQDRVTAIASPPAKDDDTQPFGDYESLQKINEGGMGIVYKAWHRGLRRWEVIKKIKPNRLSTPGAVRRFHVEIEAVAQLDHRHIVPVYHVREHRGFPYYSMKFYEKGSLQAHLTRFANPRAAAQLLITVAEAVQFAHERGILHRDLKPANILLDDHDEPHVADFGLAKRLPSAPAVRRAQGQSAPTGALADQPDDLEGMPGSQAEAEHDTIARKEFEGDSLLALDFDGSAGGQTATFEARFSTLTPTGAFVGTFPYVAPEQVTGQLGGASARSDVYSLGVILYKLLTSKLPFKAATVEEAMDQLKNCEPERPRTLNARADARLEWICLKCLRKDPAVRYASAEAFAEDLKRWLRGEWPLGYPLPWWRRAVRALRRYLFAVSLTAILSLTAATLFFVFYYFDPDRVPRELEAAAKQGRVTLIGMTGPPKWSRWNLGGDGTVKVSSGPDTPFSFTTGDRGRLELLRKAPPSYRFSAEVRHDRALDYVSLVGIYFGNMQRETQDDLERNWCDLTFADVGGLATLNVGPDGQKHSAVSFEIERHGPPIYSFSLLGPIAKKLFVSSEGSGLASDWRRLAVEVTPEKVKFFWEGNVVQEMSRADLNRLCQSTTPQYEFAPETALGLYVFKGKASFRQVTIEPLE